MAETVVKTIENIDELFSQIVVNGEVHQSTRYVPPVTAQTQTSSPSQDTQTSTSTEAVSDTPVRQTQGQDVYGVELNDVLHDFVDQRVTQALEEEVTAREDADTQLQTNIDNEEMARQQADYGLGQRITTIEEVIPNQATPSNQLADKAFVNSSIATNTANFLGTYTSMADIEAIPNPTNNDYVFLEISDASGNSGYDRYKYNAEQDEWLFEYELNNSSFTAEQWDTINSGLTQASVAGDIESAIEALDVSAVGGSGKYIKQISQTDGKITAVTGDITSSITSGSNDPVTSGAVADALANINVTDAETAEKLKTARNLKVALGSATAQSFDGSANAESIGVGGTLPVANGGTGQTTAKGVVDETIQAGIQDATADVTDTTSIITTHIEGYSSTNKSLYRRPMSALWNYIKGKIQSVALTIGSTASAIAETLYGSLTVKNSSGTTTASIAQDGKITGKSYSNTNITIKTGSTAQAKITLNTLMTWLITTKGYIPSGTACHVIIQTSWSYADNDILQLAIDGINYELQLAGVIIEFMGSATDYQSGMFRLRIHSSPTTSFTATSGYTIFPVSHIAEYTCNGSGYSPIWEMLLGIGDSARALSGTYTCSTAAATAAKTVTVPGFKLAKGARLTIVLSNANTAASALTMNVSGTGAKTIRWNGTVTSTTTYAMTATTYTCYYDGTYWNMDSGYEAYSARTAGGCSGNSSTADTTRGTAYCTTDSATQAKVASMRGYVLQSGATFPITFTNANTYNGVITLNVNSTGAKNVYINNAVTSSSNKTLPAGTYLCRYNGSYYYIDTSYFVTNARNANYASSATDAYYLGSGRGAATGYYMSPSYDSTNNWIKLNGYYGTGTFNSRNSCADVALKIRTSAPSSPSDGDIWIE